MNNIKRTGFIAPQITEDHFLLGGLSAPIIKVDGNWKDFLPVFESQLEKTFDPDSCTVHATIFALETLEKFLSQNNPNYSRRFIYNVVDITPPGSDPHLVATTIRGSGLINEEDLPDTVDSLAIYMTPRPMTSDLIEKGKNWSWQLGHEWIITPSTPKTDRVRIIKESLLKGTVCVSVTAWYQNDQGLYYSPQGLQNEHWTMVYDCDETGIYVFDSYQDAVTGNNLKKLTLDHDISYGKLYALTPKFNQEKKNIFLQLLAIILNAFGLGKKEADSIVATEAKIINQPTQQMNTPIESTPQPTNIDTLTTWDTPENCRHNVRVLCDLAGLSLHEKEIITACVEQESDFYNYMPVTGQPVKHINLNKDGTVASTDWGIVQINDHYHIGAGEDFPSVDFVMANPQKCVQFMINMFKGGKLDLWSSYKTGAYLKYMPQ